MQNNSPHNNTRDIRKQTGQQNNQNFEVHVNDIKQWKDNKEHENVRRQRQDLFDNWEQGSKKPFSATHGHSL